MIVEADFNSDSALIKLLSHAASDPEKAYMEYQKFTDNKLFAYQQDGIVIGCIGIERKSDMKCVIKHIAVSRETRGTGIGRKLIQYLFERYSPVKISAETDNDAVDFYRTLGFRITTLGEKYPGVERFLCEYMT